MNDRTVNGPAGSPIGPEHAGEHGLNPQEYERMVAILGRPPVLAEIGIFGAMWSEHCSYKSSRVWLAKLPTKGPQVIQGPGENAGVVDLGFGQAAVFKMESHNHPSFIEPYQGAATGVGGILRDVFTMGARPIANLNALRFGDPAHPRTRHLIGGVVAGIGGYGNCVGVPTVGGEVNFHPAYNGNILVNAMTVGLADASRIFYAAAAGVGNPVVYVGSKTGRDGIKGAVMASAEFGAADSQSQRPTVQVGDPFTEKLLLEACLELMATDAIIAIQDMGAAGLTSSSVEMAAKGEVGIELDLDRVPLREAGMQAYEIMLSESQERMLMVLKPGREADAEAIFRKWELDFAVIGQLTDTRHLVLKRFGEIAADIPVDPLVDAAPKYERPWVPTPPQPVLDPASLPAPDDPITVLTEMIASPAFCSRRWIIEQYDSLIRGDTLVGPGFDRPSGDAAVIELPRADGATARRALAITTDCTPRYCKADPVAGGRQAVAEAWRNLTAVGATPLAVTDNMNFGNPEKPEIMGQFAGCIMGMADACAALAFPVVSGNVSLYNETDGKAILPTPTIGAIGLVPDADRGATIGLKRAGLALILIGGDGTHLGQSAYLVHVAGREDGPPPPVDLDHERKVGDFVRNLIADGSVDTCHDISDGGLLVAVAEMALASGDAAIGAAIDIPAETEEAAWLFGEDQGRYVVAVADPVPIEAAAAARSIPTRIVGYSTGGELTVTGATGISVEALRDAHEGWLPRYMAGGSA